MKVLLLASSIQHFEKKIGKVRNLDRTIRSLILLGFKKKDIFIFSAVPIPRFNDISHFVNNVIVDCDKSDRSGLVFQKIIKRCQFNDDLIILLSDYIFNTSDFETLLLQKKSCALVSEIKKVKENGSFLNNISGKIEYFENFNKFDMPFYDFNGVIKINKCDHNVFNNSNNEPLIKICTNIEGFRLIDPQQFNSGINGVTVLSKDISGGSFAGLHKKLIIKKHANKDGAKKLNDEINWLKSLDGDVAFKFPQVIDSQMTDDYSYFEMPYYKLENFRKYLLTDYFDLDDFDFYIKKILDFVFNTLYQKEYKYLGDEWFNKIHYDRVEDRLESLEKNVKKFNMISSYKKISINGEKFIPLREAIHIIKNSNINQIVRPQKLHRIHGDLHFQNMLIDINHEDFILADPRGEINGSDIFYDMGKLWHSVNGKYDLIHTDISNYEIIDESSDELFINFKLSDEEQIKKYDNLKIRLWEILSEYPIIKYDVNSKLKMEFNEVMHFSSVMIFHLKNDEVENRAVCLYLSAIILANKFIKNYIGDKCY